MRSHLILPDAIVSGIILKWFRGFTDTIVGEIMRLNPELKREIVGKVVREMLEKMEAVDD
jgi:hypothetical protein